MITSDLSKSTGASDGNVMRQEDNDDVIMLIMIFFGFYRSYFLGFFQAWENAAWMLWALLQCVLIVLLLLE
jgi:predicted ABC-type exoprotein transport system permease subunit